MEVEGSIGYQPPGVNTVCDKNDRIHMVVSSLFAGCMFFIEIYEQSDAELIMLSWGVIDWCIERENSSGVASVRALHYHSV